MKQLTKKQQDFVEVYAETGNATEAARQAYEVSPDNADKLAYNLKQKPWIREAIEQALEAHNITPEWLVGQHKGLALNSQNDMVKTKNLEDLGEIANIYPRKGNEIEIDREGISIKFDY